MEFWMANTPRGPATLCDRCCLLAVNNAAFRIVRRPYGTMGEAMADIDQRCIAAGLTPLELRRSAVGVCGHCGEDQLEPVAS